MFYKYVVSVANLKNIFLYYRNNRFAIRSKTALLVYNAYLAKIFYILPLFINKKKTDLKTHQGKCFLRTRSYIKLFRSFLIGNNICLGKHSYKNFCSKVIVPEAFFNNSGNILVILWVMCSSLLLLYLFIFIGKIFFAT